MEDIDHILEASGTGEQEITEPLDSPVASPAVPASQPTTKEKPPDIGITIDKETGKIIFNANILAEHFQTHFRLLVHEGQLFFKFEDGVWRQLHEYQLRRLIRDTVESAKKNIYRTWMGNEAMELLRVALPEAGEMNLHRHLINLTNGMYDANNGQLLPHDEAYRSTVQIPLAYRPKADCIRFERFVREIMQDDPERVAVLQELVGYLLSPETKLHFAYFFYGQGSNGKSVLLDIIAKLVGTENISTLSLADLENSFKRANLIDKRLNIASENEVSPKGFNSQYFKAITSGDPITVEHKFRDCFSYIPVCKMLYAVNNLPHTVDKTHGFYRRVFILPFNQRFEGKNDDRDLKSKLETELSGIFNWAVEGLKRLRGQNYQFSRCAAIEEVLSQYKEDQNPILSYMGEMLEGASPGSRISKAAVFEKFNGWTQRNGLGDGAKMSTARFWNTYRANCRELGLPYDQQISNGVRYLKGIALRPETQVMNSILKLK